MKNHWNKQDIPNLEGKTAIVTGANSGLGFETVMGLAAAGAQVILACRNAEKTETAMRHIHKDVPQAKLAFMTLDLASLTSLRTFAQQFSAEHTRLDLLCNNAGVMALPLRRTQDGFEMQIGTNHLGHFALTGLLLPLLQNTPGARVVTQSSGYHKRAKTIRFNDLNWQHDRYAKWPAYDQSKLANLLFAFELQRKFVQHGIAAISVAAHPGYAATNLQITGPEMENSGFRKVLMRFANAVIAQNAQQGALPILCAATSDEINGGDYIGPDGLGELRGSPKKVSGSKQAQDTIAAAKLWQLSEQLTGVSYLA